MVKEIERGVRVHLANPKKQSSKDMRGDSGSASGFGRRR